MFARKNKFIQFACFDVSHKTGVLLAQRTFAFAVNAVQNFIVKSSFSAFGFYWLKDFSAVYGCYWFQIPHLNF